MSSITYSGTVSAQATPGETVTITVTKPDGSKDVLATITLANGSYSVSNQYSVAGNYSASMHMDADADYVAVDVGPVSFVVPSQPRTGTLVVNVS